MLSKETPSLNRVRLSRAQALQRGGFTLYFRHARTDVSQNDRDTKDFDDCARQRNLSDAGRGDARAVAAASARAGPSLRAIPVEDWPRLVQGAPRVP